MILNNSQKGSGLLGLVLTLSTIGLICLTLLGGYSYKLNSKLKRKSEAFASNTFNLGLLAEKFRITDRQKPIWYPIPYPSKEDISNEKLPPIIGVVQEAKDTSYSLVQTRLNTGDPIRGFVTLTPDISLMGSVMKISEIKKDSNGKSKEAQIALLASGNMNSIPQEQLAQFVSAPGQSWPKMNGERALAGLTQSKVSFLKYVADKTFPTWAKAMLVSITATDNQNRTTTSMATVALDAPPSPACKLELAGGAQKSVLIAGTYVQLVLSADSLATLGKIQYTYSENGKVVPVDKNIFISQPQTIKNLGTFVPVHTGESFQIPTHPNPGNSIASGPFKGAQLWRVEGRVFGVKNDGEEIQCALDIAVKVPDPICNLAASEPRIRKGQSTNLTLTCQNQVDKAYIDSIPVQFNGASGIAVLKYTKKYFNQTEKVTARAIGPSGAESNPSTLIGPGTCRFNDPNFVEMYPFPYGWHELYAGEVKETGGIAEREYARGRYEKYVRIGGNAGPLYGGLFCNNNAICMMGWQFRYYKYQNQAYVLDSRPRGKYWAQYGPANVESCGLQKVQVRSSGCFVSGTKILMANGNSREIERMEVGDWVRNPLNNKILRIKNVTVGPEYKPLWTITVENKNLSVTDNHPFLTRTGVKRADKLTNSDQIKTEKGWLNITNVKRESNHPKESVWNIELDSTDESDHYVLANGIPAGDLWLQNRILLP